MEDLGMQMLKQEKYQTCIDTCMNCAETCEACATDCTKDSNIKMLAKCLFVLRDCADICTMSSRFMSRTSMYSKNMCRVCADICDACAAEGDKHKSMESCKVCADACRMCASECRKMMA